MATGAAGDGACTKSVSLIQQIMFMFPDCMRKDTQLGCSFTYNLYFT
jgi:hypothetical protein